jgi:GAF domain-containing protein
VPVIQNSEVTAVIDIDSKELDTFDDTDRIWLEKIGTLFAGKTA